MGALRLSALSLAATLAVATQAAAADAPQTLAPQAPPTPAPETGEAPPTRLHLQDAIDRALAKNPTYTTALLDVRRADAIVRETKAAWLPTLTGNGTLTHLDGNRIENGAIILAQNELGANLTAVVPIIATRQWLTTEETRVTQEASQATSADVRRLVTYATAQAYLAVYAQKLVIEVDETARDNARSHASYAQQRYKGGVGNLIDEVRAEQELAADVAIVEQGYSQLTTVEEALGILVGAEGPVDTADDVSLPEPPSLADGLESALTRTDVIALERKKKAADKVVHDNWSDYAPYLAGSAAAFYQNPALPTVPLTGYQLELLLTVPLYDGGLRYGQHRERDALRDEASVAYEAGLRQAKSDVRAAFVAMRRAEDAVRSSRDSAKLAAQALDLANTAYHAGAITNIEVIDAERQSRDAATQAEVAADASRQARLTMLAVSGRFP